ncbi:tautomerase family protein [Puniceibacterium sp. IMCC21224]|uniref:tautomerase family protein n=1 Tax=Puniceibacterium sp. IMCC21224 TaxID=1618204 RepID=UPI00064E01EF|nr:tautomerase family protein [Puniceibacterium sp. IMCC21224]KMK64793.1 uncharacterized protein, 4-oxalocrotonate tautomerase [Puniceibacterium sp. IMCC21224]
MPFIEVTDHGPSEQIREVASRHMTDGLCQAFAIKPEIVTVYYNSMGHYSYAHAGKYGKYAENIRIFIKVHAFPRGAELKADAAQRITDAVVAAYGASPKDVIVYFFDTAPADAFHGGTASG